MDHACGSPEILDFFVPYFMPRYSQGTPLRVLQTRWVDENAKNADFRPVSHYVSETIENRHVVTITTEDKQCCNSILWIKLRTTCVHI